MLAANISLKALLNKPRHPDPLFLFFTPSKSPQSRHPLFLCSPPPIHLRSNPAYRPSPKVCPNVALINPTQHPMTEDSVRIQMKCKVFSLSSRPSRGFHTLCDSLLIPMKWRRRGQPPAGGGQREPGRRRSGGGRGAAAADRSAEHRGSGSLLLLAATTRALSKTHEAKCAGSTLVRTQ
jgi:hypothetical protein